MKKIKIKIKIKTSHDNKITVQVFNTLLSKFPQIITNLTEDTELVFTEKLKKVVSDYHLAYCASVTYLERIKFKHCC